MRKLFFVLISICLLSLYSCDDGDIITFNLDFGDEFYACEGVSDLVIYKTKDDPSESISVLISSFSIEDMLAVESNDTLKIEDKSASFNYRTYNDASISNLFCNEIPANLDINVDETSDCEVDIFTVLTEDDNDGIPSELEDINENGDLTDDDTDGDGIPNYKDADDDGDNVLTKNELPDPNGDGDIIDAQDTDGDLTPDYLDEDDDGDGVKTRDEENASQDNNPANDITNEEVGADYLNDVVKNTVPATAYRNHTYTQEYLIAINIKNIDITELSQDELDFGTYGQSTIGTVSITPDFN
ncbi:hypothetical protein N1F78_14950 [Seonamhaeicola sp. MEBiC1930]|uniref:hypothetical protein n=1 Tax=Seonamhaeicola sp. MEBiC01930 TaxID=2976768 RepID=UPI00324E188D